MMIALRNNCMNVNSHPRRIFLFTVIHLIPLFLSAAVSLEWNSSFSHGWSLTPDSMDLADGAGSNYSNTILSPLYTEALTINADGSWTLYIEGNPFIWNEEAKLSFRALTPDPDLLGFIQDTFIPCTTTPVRVASGTGNIELIGIQYSISDLNVEPFKPSSWNTEIYFTVVEE